MLREGATKLLCLWAGGDGTFICVTRWNILTRGSADSKTPQREKGWGWEGSKVSARNGSKIKKKNDWERNVPCQRDVSLPNDLSCQEQKVRIRSESWLWTKKPKGELKWEWEMWLVCWLWKPPALGWQQGQWECPLLVRPLNGTHPLHKPAVL